MIEILGRVNPMLTDNPTAGTPVKVCSFFDRAPLMEVRKFINFLDS